MRPPGAGFRGVMKDMPEIRENYGPAGLFQSKGTPGAPQTAVSDSAEQTLCPAPTRAHPSAVVLLLVALTCCHEVGAVLSLQSGLATRFPSLNVGVTLTPPSTLTVEFRSQPASEQERREVALQAAEFVRDHYADYRRLQVVNVSFDSVANIGTFSLESKKIVYRFARGSLGEPSKQLPSS